MNVKNRTILVFVVVAAVVAGTQCRAKQAFVRHTDKAYGFTISYPQYWRIVPADVVSLMERQLPEGRKLLFTIWSADTKLNFQVTVDDVELESTLDALYEKVIAAAPLKRDNIEKKKIQLQGIRAIKCYFTTTVPDGRSAKYVEVVVLRGSKFWRIGGGGEPRSFDQNKVEIDEIISSFSFDSESKGKTGP